MIRVQAAGVGSPFPVFRFPNSSVGTFWRIETGALRAASGTNDVANPLWGR